MKVLYQLLPVFIVPDQRFGLFFGEFKKKLLLSLLVLHVETDFVAFEDLDRENFVLDVEFAGVHELGLVVERGKLFFGEGFRVP